MSALVAMKEQPLLCGLDSFLNGIEAAIAAGQGTREMQELIAAFRRHGLAHPRLPGGRDSAAA